MKKTYSPLASMVCLGFTYLMLASCGKSDNKLIQDTLSFYNINGTTFNGASTNDTAARLLTTNCQNNNIMMLHYSDSVLKMGFPDKMKVTSIAHSGHLAYHECYIEVSTTAADTWLSTGADSAQVVMMDPQSDFTVQPTQMQHYTTMPLNDFGTFHATVIIKK